MILHTVVVVVVVTVDTTSPVSSSITSPVVLLTVKFRFALTPSICPSFFIGTTSEVDGFGSFSLLAYAESATLLVLEGWTSLGP